MNDYQANFRNLKTPELVGMSAEQNIGRNNS